MWIIKKIFSVFSSITFFPLFNSALIWLCWNVPKILCSRKIYYKRLVLCLLFLLYLFHCLSVTKNVVLSKIQRFFFIFIISHLIKKGCKNRFLLIFSKYIHYIFNTYFSKNDKFQSFKFLFKLLNYFLFWKYCLICWFLLIISGNFKLETLLFIKTN